MHDIDTKEKCTTYKKTDFPIIFSGYIIPVTSHGSKLCFIINLYFYTIFVDDFTPFYSNDGTALVTHFSSTLTVCLDQLTKYNSFITL